MTYFVFQKQQSSTPAIAPPLESSKMGLSRVSHLSSTPYAPLRTGNSCVSSLGSLVVVRIRPWNSVFGSRVDCVKRETSFLAQ